MNVPISAETGLVGGGHLIDTEAAKYPAGLVRGSSRTDLDFDREFASSFIMFSVLISGHVVDRSLLVRM